MTGYHRGQPYVSEPRVKDFIRWTKTLKDEAVLERTVVGGHYCYPLRDAGGADDLKRALESLHYPRTTGGSPSKELIAAVRYVQQPPGNTQVPAAERLGRGPHHPEQPEDSSSESESPSESDPPAAGSTSQKGSGEWNPDSAELNQPLQWESSDWPRQRQDVLAHLCGDGLHQDSLTRRFSFEEKSSLLHWSGLPPSHWTPDQPSQTLPPVAWPGYYHTTILEDPRAEGLPLDPHGNSLLSCLSAGFLCPLGDPTTPEIYPPSPEEILHTAGELEGVHLLCILDLCHLGGDRVEIVLHKVYRLP
ncbi:hypothetical protein CRUP_011472 [Coryphaenoides rupestris]|nr:hypothetical protein CRUP_011472 [Coryphaenoides rupestris]